MITDERVQALAREAKEAWVESCRVYSERSDFSAEPPMVGPFIASALTTALEEDLAALEAAIRCLPSFPGGSADPCDFWGVHMVGVEAVCALVRGEG